MLYSKNIDKEIKRHLKAEKDNKLGISLELIDNYKNSLLNDERLIKKQEFGAGLRKNNTGLQSVKEMAKRGSCSLAMSEIILKLLHCHKDVFVLEFGTQLGVGTFTFLQSEQTKLITSIEACTNTLDIAKEYLKYKELAARLEIINSDFDSYLPLLNSENRKFNFFYIDGNHRGDATYNYYRFCKTNLVLENSIILFDDITWSLDMYKTWRKIKSENKRWIFGGRFGIIFI